MLVSIIIESHFKISKCVVQHIYLIITRLVQWYMEPNGIQITKYIYCSIIVS